MKLGGKPILILIFLHPNNNNKNNNYYYYNDNNNDNNDDDDDDDDNDNNFSKIRKIRDNLQVVQNTTSHNSNLIIINSQKII